MKFIDNINKETLLIVPSNIKEKVLNYISVNKKLVNIKLLSFEELKRIVYFDYDINCISYLMKKYNYRLDVAKNYLNNIYYIEDKKYNSGKLNFLVSLKKELDDNNLLLYDKDYFEYLKRKDVVVFGYDYISKFNMKILSYFSNCKVYDKEVFDRVDTVYELDSLEEEVYFVIRKIIDLINNNVSINNIHLVNVSSEYISTINRLFTMHKIPIDLKSSNGIITSLMGKNAFDKLVECNSFKETLDYLKDNFDLSNENVSSIYSKIMNIFNKYSVLDGNPSDYIDLINYDFINTKNSGKKLENIINVSDLSNNYFSDDDYVFLLGFNQGVIPVIHRDEDYISDNLKEEVNLDMTYSINKYELNSCIKNIKSIKNITIAYKHHYMDTEFYPSNLINMDAFNNEKGVIDYLESYSLDYSKIKLSTMIDDLIKYDKKNDLLSNYFNSFNIPYMVYNNKYNGIDIVSLKDLLKNKLVLSYSNVNTYYKCGFRFYLDNVLKINKYEESFEAYVGSLFHFVLSKFYNSNFDLDREYDYFLESNKKDFSSKELFFINKLKKELVIICDRLKEFNDMTGLTNVYTEKNISIDKSVNDVDVVFKGIVDKIMYKDFEGKTNVAIIDYKTGAQDIDIYNSVYGIGMQLIIYLYLISKSGLFEDMVFVGFYLQRILNNEVNIETNKSYKDIKNDNLKLYGYSNLDVNVLSRFDTTFENSEYIKSMKYGEKGFSSYSKVLDDVTMDKLVKLVDTKIDVARDNILAGKFDINPKHISDDKEITGCAFCKYKDICFMKNEDIVELSKYKDLIFLEEGDDNA